MIRLRKKKNGKYALVIRFEITYAKAKRSVYTFSIAFLLWIGISFVDVIAHNMSDQDYLSFNAFVLFVEAIESK